MLRRERCTSTLHRPLRPLRTHTRAARNLDASWQPVRRPDLNVPKPRKPKRLGVDPPGRGVPTHRAASRALPSPVQLCPRTVATALVAPGARAAWRGFSRPLALLLGAECVPCPAIPSGMLHHPSRPRIALVDEPSCSVRVSAHPISAPATGVSVPGALPSTSTRTERCTAASPPASLAYAHPRGAQPRRLWQPVRRPDLNVPKPRKPKRLGVDPPGRGVPTHRAASRALPSPVQLCPRTVATALVAPGARAAWRGFSRPLALLLGAECVPCPAIPSGMLHHPSRPRIALVEQPRASCPNRPFMRFQRFAGLRHRTTCECDRDVRNPRHFASPFGELAVEAVRVPGLFIVAGTAPPWGDTALMVRLYIARC